jgi:hypothetical protein
MKHGAAILLLVGLVSGVPTIAAAQVADLIVGSWEWTSTGCDNGTVVSTPETAGYTLQCQYSSVADGSIYRAYRDGTLQAQGTYILSQVPALLGLLVDVLDITVGESTTRYAFVRVDLLNPDTGGKRLGMDSGLCGYSWTSRATVTGQGTSWGAIKTVYR